MVALGLVSEEAIPPMAGFAIQGFLEEWEPGVGWLQVLDWVGNPNLPMLDIENELNIQYQSFITGIDTDNEFSFDFTPPKNPKKREIIETTKSPPSPPKARDDDFDWI